METNKTTNILIVGVGGQGVILASELLSKAAMVSGYDVKQSEVHGMSQRGGVVSSHIRFAKKVHSPLIPNGAADVILAFEASEGLRWVNQLSQTGAMVVNTQEIVPPIAFTKEFNYPEDPIGQAKAIAARVVAIDGIGIAESCGDKRLVNTVLLGAISKELPIDGSVWENVIRSGVPKGTEEINLKAFRLGADAVK